MKTSWVVLMFVVISLIAAACASTTNAAFDDSAEPPTATQASEPEQRDETVENSAVSSEPGTEDSVDEEPADDGGSGFERTVERRIEPNSWQLEELSEDRRTLTVSAYAGACETHRQLEFDESDDAVEIRTSVTRRIDPSNGCPPEGGGGREDQITLQEPLGDRLLTGCLGVDCRSLDHFESPASVLVAEDALAVAGFRDLLGLDTTGELASRTPFPAPSSEVVEPAAASVEVPAVATGESTAVYSDEVGNAIAIDLLSGEQLWTADGDFNFVAEDERAVYSCGQSATSGVQAVDPATGNGLWQNDLRCDDLFLDGEQLTVFGGEQGSQDVRVVTLSVASGELISDQEFPEQFQDPDRNEVFEVTDGVAIIRTGERVIGFELDTQSELWGVNAFRAVGSRFEPSELLVFDEGSIWRLDFDGTIARLDSRTGETLWSVRLEFAPAFDVAVSEDIAYVLIGNRLSALDATTGEVLWSPFQNE